jgi:uncharacterized spore protein YtfJ
MTTATPVTPATPTTPFQPVADVLERGLSIRLVYGEPIHEGSRTVVPVARVAFGFGAGGGTRPRRRRNGPAGPEEAPDHAEQGGGGGGARLTPAGALVITPRRTRFVRYGVFPRLLGAFALGAFAGALVASRRR